MSSAHSDTEKSEDTSTSSSSDSESPLKDEIIRLKSENLILKERILELQKDLFYSKNELDSCYDTLRTISSLRKPFRQPPPEILLMIFDRTIPPSFIVDASASHSLNSMWCKVLQQKMAIVNVCQTWHKIGLPFLYEDICIQHISQLRRLLRTLENPASDIKEFVKTVSFNCFVPAWFGSQFGQRLQLLFDLCPGITSFSYLSSCQLPSANTLSVLPSHITQLQLVEGVSIALLNNVLNLMSLNIVSLSIHIPFRDILRGDGGQILYFRQLEELTFGVNSKTISKLNDFCLNWDLSLLTRLTFRMYGSWDNDLSTNPFNVFCRKHASVGLTFLHIYPEYGWSMPNFTLPMQDLLDLCPNLEHIVIHPRTLAPLTHQRVKWVDIWSSHAVSSCNVFWQSVRDSITPSTFPSLQGIRHLSSSLAFAPNLPLILPPGHVSTPVDSFAYTFLELDVHHDVGEIYLVQPLEDKASDEDDSDYEEESTDSDSESEGSSSVSGDDSDPDTVPGHSQNWEAIMDALE